MRRRTSTVNIGGVEILPLVNHPSRQAAAGDQVVHAVEGPQYGALAAAGGADERGDLAAGNAEEHPFDSLKGAVADRDVFAADRHLIARHVRDVAGEGHQGLVSAAAEHINEFGSTLLTLGKA